MTERVTIEHRALVLVNTDPQRRCYDGYHAESEWQWTAWSVLEENMPPSRLEFWQNLTAYAVKERGKSATKEYRIA